MSQVQDLLRRFPRETGQDGPTNTCPFKLTSTLSTAATDGEIVESWSDRPIPVDVVEAWPVSAESRLCVDQEYGQWGLVLLAPQASAGRTIEERKQRPSEWLDGDVVFGEFLGDQELLVVTATGGVLIALPLDGRSEWYRAANSLAAFLDHYLIAAGDKFWEPSR